MNDPAPASTGSPPLAKVADRTSLVGAAEGLSVGIAYVVAEVSVGYLGGDQLPLLWWALHALYAIPALTVVGLTARLAGRRRTDDDRIPDDVVPYVLLFVQLVVTCWQDILSSASPVSPSRMGIAVLCAVLAWHAWRTQPEAPRSRAGGWVLHLALCLAIVAGSAVATDLHAGGSRGWLLLAIPYVGVLLVDRVADRLLRARRPARHLATAALLLPVCAVCLGGLLSDGRSPLLYRDDPQPTSGTGRAHRPDIVLIVLDTLRARNLSCYGYARPTTPHLDALAHHATLYTNCFSTSSWTLPAHGSLFTGLYPSLHGAHGPSAAHPSEAPHPLRDSVATLAQVLRQNGYATAAIAANSAWLTTASGLDRGFAVFDARLPNRISRETLLRRVYRWLAPRMSRLPSLAHDLLRPLDEWFASPYRNAEQITDAAMAWLSTTEGSDCPRFLFLNYMDAHYPYVPRGIYRRRSGTDDVPRGMLPHELLPDDMRDIVAGRRGLTPAERSYLESQYDGAIAYLDSQLGRLFRRLDAGPTRRDVWLIVTADHGESIGQHGTLGHTATLYQELLHVPLIVKYPTSLGAAAAPRIVREPVQLVDVMPTVLARLGIEPPRRLDGVPIGSGRTTMFAEVHVHPDLLSLNPERYRRDLCAVVDGSLKYIESSRGEQELYDLAEDPLEAHNLAAQRPKDVARLQALLAPFDWAPTEPEPPSAPSEEQRDALRALGYLH